MTSYILLFIKNGMVADKIYFNGPTKTFFEAELWRNFKKTLDKKRLKFIIQDIGFNPDKQSIGFYKVVDLILHPVCKLYIDSDTIVRIIKKDHWKKNVVKLLFTKEGGWSMNKSDHVSESIIDTKKDFDYVVYMTDDGGESKDLAFMGRLIDIIQNVDALIKLNSMENEK